LHLFRASSRLWLILTRIVPLSQKLEFFRMIRMSVNLADLTFSAKENVAINSWLSWSTLRVCKSTLNIEFHIETLKKLTLTSTLSTFQCFNFPHWHWIEFNVWDSIYWKTTQCFQCLNVSQCFSIFLNISQYFSIFSMFHH